MSFPPKLIAIDGKCAPDAASMAAAGVPEAGMPADAARTALEAAFQLAATDAAKAAPSSTPEQTTEHKRELDQLNGWFEIALDNMARGLSMFDANQRLVVCNKMYREIYNLPQELTRPGTPLTDIVRYHVEREAGAGKPENDERQRKWMEQHLKELSNGKSFSYVQELRDGRIILVSNQPLADGGWVDLQEDVTEKRRAEQRISWLARHDALTEIANRFHFREQLAAALQDLKPSDGFALHWIDLDKFKYVNDTYGHPVGDDLLQSVARRLSDTVRSVDVVGRLGGDEFVILQRNTKRAADAERLATRLLQVIGDHHELGGYSLHTDACIGIALAPDHSCSPDELLKYADIALYKAKAQSGNRFAFFEPGEDKKIKARQQLESDLKAALKSNQLALHYQPIVHLANKDVTSFEALMRWHHPSRGLVGPADFIPIAEQTGFIVPMGEWALEQACRDAANWPRPIKVTVNLSSVQFESGDLIRATERALKLSGLDPQRLELEITESVLLRDVPRTHEVLARLQELGVQIALDDFGTAFASLSYLQSFPFDKIKIDRSFVRDAPERADCLAIVRAVTDLGRNLHIATVAEGIETLEHVNMVMEAGCDEVQGFYFSRPVPPNEVDRTLSLCRLKCLIPPMKASKRRALTRIRRVGKA